MSTNVVEGWRARPADTPAIVGDDGVVTWHDLVDLTSRLAARYREVAGSGGRVAVTGDNLAITLVAHLAGILGGVGTVATARQWTPTEMARQFRDASVRAVVAGPRAAEAAAAAAAECNAVAVAHGTSLDSAVPLEEWICDQPSTSLPVDEPVQVPLVYTSGTTGTPKGTPVRWGPLGTTARQWTAAVAARGGMPDGPHLVVGPLQHNGPLTALRHLLRGQPVVVLPRFDAGRVLETIEAHGVTSCVMVPTHFRRLLDLPEDIRRTYDVSSLRLVPHTGSKCPPDIKRAMIAWLGPVLLESYGGSEVGTLARIDSHEWLAHPTSVGRVVEPFEVVVTDEVGRPLPQGDTGLLCFRAPPDRRPRFHGADQKSSDAFVTDELFTLGDIGRVDADGYIEITDRRAETVVSGGVNVYPAEAEDVLMAHPAVREVAVVGAPHTDLGEALHAVVVLESGASTTANDLEAHARAQLAGYKVPKSWEFRTDLPRNAMEKIDKKTLRAEHWQGTSHIGG